MAAAGYGLEIWVLRRHFAFVLKIFFAVFAVVGRDSVATGFSRESDSAVDLLQGGCEEMKGMQGACTVLPILA